MNHGSLFSGIGGFDLASEWMGWNNIFQVEKDEFCKKVLKKNFPKVKRYGDIKEFNGSRYKGAVDIISGGFPCQPFSTAGKRKGTADDRYLWDEMLRVISEVKPSWVVGENVADIRTMDNGKTLENILFDLEGEGYKPEVYIIPACAIKAEHRRDRVWIIAYSKSFRRRIQGKNEVRNPQKTKPHRGHQLKSLGSNPHEQLIAAGSLRVDNGLPKRVDRLKGLRNAIVPQVVYEIFKAIEIEQTAQIRMEI